MSDTSSEPGAVGGKANLAETPHPVVVAIGVSRDGVSPLQRALASFEETLKAVVLVVRHTTPTRPSLLALVLGRVIKPPVTDAVAGERLKPGVVYVAPSDLHLTVADGHAELSAPSIDVLFESVARVCGAHPVGVLLSAGGKDGALARDGHRVARIDEISEAVRLAVARASTR
jgi:two-component system, chemotaxis family, protein-glutamate methylesterase/glutaminase